MHQLTLPGVGARVTRAFLFTVAVVAALLLASAPARAAGPGAVENLAGCTADTFPGNDDGSVSNVPIGFTANFFNTEYTKLFVNNNGNVTFDQALGDYTPFDFTTTGNVIIAPYLADVDTRVGQAVTYGSGTLGDGTKYFCVNWVNVGYYLEHTDKLNSFQLLLTQSPSQAATNNNFTITFNYDQIQWETGDASGGTGGFGGTPAAVGFAAGDGVTGHQYVQPGSFSSGAFEDSNGRTGLINNSLNSGNQLGRYVFPVVNGPVSGGTVTGTVFAHDGTTPLEFAPVDICPAGGGVCITRSTNSSGVYRAGGVPAGSYNVTGYPPPGDSEQSATVGPKTVTDGAGTTADVTLGPNPNAPPDGTTLTGVGTNPDGIPVINWEQTGTLTTVACGGAQLTWAMTLGGQQIAGGPMTQVTTTNPNDGSATYQATYPVVAPNHGQAHIAITGNCPVGNTPVDDAFDIYIDPSGKVVDTNGSPIAGATVTLMRSDSPTGPFIQVPDGSAEMSPANRNNPDTSATDGSFGWDTVAGYYEIQATAPGCSSTADHSDPIATSPVLAVPPPQTGLQVVMFCGSSAPTGGGGGGGGGGGAGGGTAGIAGTGTTVAGPTATAASVSALVAASLSSQLHGLLTQLKTKLSALGVKSFAVAFNAVQPGVLAIKVTTVVPHRAGAAGAKHKPPKAKPITVAVGRLTVGAAGQLKVTIRVTPAGRAALQQAAKHHKQLKLKLSESFAPSFGGQLLPAIQPTGTFSVRPHAAKKKTKK